MICSGKELIDSKLLQVEEKLSFGQDSSGFLSSLMSTMSVEEMYANVSELMAAAVDTVSHYTSNYYIIDLHSVCESTCVRGR